MIIAGDSVSGEIVHDHDLRRMDNLYIQTTTFECPHDKCRMPAIPCSFKEINLNQSYSRYEETHRLGYKIHGPKSKNKCNSRNNKKHSSPPALAISLLKFDVSERNCDSSDRRIIRQTRNDEKNLGGKAHPMSSSNIKPVVDYYINGNNLYEPLSIPSYRVGTYRDTFQLIVYEERIRYDKSAIYFGKIQSNVRLEIDSSRYYLTFLAREKGTKQAYKLEVDTSEWGESKESFFCSEYEKQRARANKCYNRLKDKRRATKYFNIFFLSLPDECNSFLFKTSCFKLVCIVFLDDFGVTYNNENYSVEKERLVRDKVNKEHLTGHQNRINLAEVAGVTEVAEVAEAVEVAEVAGVAKVAEVAEVAEIAKVAEATEVAGIAEVAEVAEVAGVVEVTEIAEVAEVAEIAEVAEVAEVARVAEVAEVAGVAEVTEVAEVVEVAKIAKVVEVAETAEVADFDESEFNPPDSDRKI